MAATSMLPAATPMQSRIVQKKQLVDGSVLMHNVTLQIHNHLYVHQSVLYANAPFSSLTQARRLPSIVNGMRLAVCTMTCFNLHTWRFRHIALFSLELHFTCQHCQLISCQAL